jgi:hypothetical protein
MMKVQVFVYVCCHVYSKVSEEIVAAIFSAVVMSYPRTRTVLV